MQQTSNEAHNLWEVPPRAKPTESYPMLWEVVQLTHRNGAVRGVACAKKRYKPIVKCGKYQERRNPATHKHYFGFWYCQETVTNFYEQWLVEVKAAWGE